MRNLRDGYSSALIELGHKNEDIIVLDADLALSTKTKRFGTIYPDRFFDMGVAEANMMGVAAGFAACGKIVFASTFAVFATGRCYDQIRQSIAYPKMNVKIVATHAGISVGGDGASHQMLEDIALMRVLPNMMVFAPSDATQTRRIVELMATKYGPMYARVGRATAPAIYKKDDLKNLKFGKGIVSKDGEDISLIACGTMVDYALDARKLLLKEGIKAQVIDMHTIKPIDKSLVLTCAKETNAIITAEEHSIVGGLGSAVSEILSEERCSCKFRRIGVQDIFCESGEPKDLFEKYGLNAKHIAKTAKALHDTT